MAVGQRRDLGPELQRPERELFDLATNFRTERTSAAFERLELARMARNFTFEAILNESDSSMDFVYQNIVFPTGDTHNNLVGVQNSGTVGTTFEYAAASRLVNPVNGTSLHVAFVP